MRKAAMAAAQARPVGQVYCEIFLMQGDQMAEKTLIRGGIPVEEPLRDLPAS